MEMIKQFESLQKNQKNYFIRLYNPRCRHVSTGVLLALSFGMFGAHRFYLKQGRWGIFYIIFCWTGVPYLIALIEAFFMPQRVKQFNIERQEEIYFLVKNMPEKDLPDTPVQIQNANIFLNAFLLAWFVFLILNMFYWDEMIQNMPVTVITLG